MKATSKRARKYGTRIEKQQQRKIKKNTIEGIRNLLEEEKFKLAKVCIDEYIKENGKDCYIIHEYGKYYQKQFLLDEARNCYEQNIKNNSENICYSLYELSKIEKIEGNYEKCIEYLISIIRSKHYDKRFAKLELAKTYITLEKYKDAEELLTELYKENKDPSINEKIMCFLLQIKIYSKKIIEAEIFLEQIKSKFNNSFVKLLEGQLEELKGNKVKSCNIYNEIIKNNDKYTSKATFLLARLEMEIGNYERTIELVDLFLKNGNMYSIELFELKINSYIKIHDYEKAKEQIKELMMLNKYEDRVNYYLGKIEFYKQNYSDALKYYSNVDTMNLRIYVETLNKKICCYIKEKRYKDAYKIFEMLKENDLNGQYKNKYNIYEIYLKTMINQPYNVEPKSYVENLLIKYDYDSVIEHISKHKQEIGDKKIILSF